MKEQIREIFPEVNLIEDEKLKDQVLEAWVMATKRGGYQPEDIKRIPFTLVKKVDINFAQHVQSVTRICLKVAETFDEVYKGALTLNKDILLAGALLHDVGKMLEIEEKDGKVRKSSSWFATPSRDWPLPTLAVSRTKYCTSSGPTRKKGIPSSAPLKP